MSAAATTAAAALTATPSVLMFVPHYPYPVVGGLERQAHELAKALRYQGVRVLVLAARFNPAHHKMDSVEGVPVRRVYCSPPRRLQLPWATLQIARALWQLRKQYSVLHVHQNSWAGLFCTWFGVKLGYKVMAKLPNVGDYGIPGVSKGRVGLIRLRMLKSAHCIVALSAESCHELEAVGYPRAQTLQVANGIEASRASTGTPVHQCGAKPRVRVVYVGRFSEEKCVHHLLEAWALAMRALTHFATLELWSNGPLQAELQALAAKLGITESVAFRGHVADVRLKLPEMDLFVLASRVEGNSNAILEAMDAGLPIVATWVGGTPMPLGALGAEWLVAPGDIEGMADRIVRLLEDRDLRLALGDAMRHRIEQHFSMECVAQVYRHTYKRLIGEDPINLTDLGGWPA